MLDAINGLSITSEILLRQLRQTFNTISTRDNRPFNDNPELDRALEEWYLQESSAADRTTTLSRGSAYIPILRTVLASPFFNITIRKGLRPLLRKHEAVILKHIEDGPLDLPRNLLCVLNENFKTQTYPWNGPASATRPGTFGIPRLHRILLITNILSTITVLAGQVGTEYQEFKTLRGRHSGKYFNSSLVLVLQPFQDAAILFQLIIEFILTDTILSSLESFHEPQIEKIDKLINEVFTYIDQNPLSLYALVSSLAHIFFFITPNFSTGRTDTVITLNVPS